VEALCLSSRGEGGIPVRGMF